MSIVLDTPNGQEIIIDPFIDQCLYSSPRKQEFSLDFLSSCEDPQEYERSGVDLYAHLTETGKVYYYTYAWKRGTEPECSHVNREMMKSLIVEIIRLKHFNFNDYDSSEYPPEERIPEEENMPDIQIYNPNIGFYVEKIRKHFPELFYQDEYDKAIDEEFIRLYTLKYHEPECDNYY